MSRVLPLRIDLDRQYFESLDQRFLRKSIARCKLGQRLVYLRGIRVGRNYEELRFPEYSKCRPPCYGCQEDVSVGGDAS
jgi:hypothetical protein